MTTDIKVNGLSELQAFLDELPGKIQRNIMRSALRAGAQVIAQEAKEQLASEGSVKTGKLRDSISVSTRARGGQVTAHAGAHDQIAVLVEYGTKRHVIRAKEGALLIGGYGFAKAVMHPGARPKPFMRPALDARAQDAVVAAGEQIKARLTKQGIDASDVLLEGDT